MKRNEKSDKRSPSISTTFEVLLVGSKLLVSTNDLLTCVVEELYTTHQVGSLR
jgi:hypothetical protein